MAREHFEAVLNSGFDATVHMRLGHLEDLIHNAFCEGVLTAEIEQKGSAGNVVHRASLSRPSLAALELGNANPVPISPDIVAADGKPLEDPELPANLGANGLLEVLLEARLPVRLEPRSPESPLVDAGIERLDMHIVVIARPWFSPGVGIGFQRYDVQVELDAAVRGGIRKELNDLEQILYTPKVLPAIYPEVMGILREAVLPLPSMNGREVAGVHVILAEDGIHPDSVVIALGGSGDLTSLQTVLDPEDDLFLVVGKTLFDEQTKKFEEKYPQRTRNWDGARDEIIHSIELRLADDAIRLSGSLTVEPDSRLTPNVSFEFSGPIRFINETDAEGRPQLAIDAGGIRADAEFDDLWKRIVIDILTLGLAEIWFTPGLDSAEGDAENEISKTIRRQLSVSLLGPFTDGLELIGIDRFVSRVSVVPWMIPTYGVLREAGYIIGGLSVAGIKHRPREITITRLGRADNRTVAYGFDDEFYLDKDKSVDYYLSRRMTPLNNVFVADRHGTPHFRTKPDLVRSNNLSELPVFSVRATFLVDANGFVPYPASGRQYWADDGRLIDLP